YAVYQYDFAVNRSGQAGQHTAFRAKDLELHTLNVSIVQVRDVIVHVRKRIEHAVAGKIEVNKYRARIVYIGRQRGNFKLGLIPHHAFGILEFIPVFRLNAKQIAIGGRRYVDIVFVVVASQQATTQEG